MINTILIDLDDTLINSKRLYQEVLPQVYDVFIKKTKLNMSYRQFEKLYKKIKLLTKTQVPAGAPSHNRAIYFQKLVETIDYDFDIELIYSMYDTFYKYIYKNAEVIPGAKNFLKWAKESGFTIIIVSDGNAHVRIKKLKALDIARYIDYLVCSEESGFEKPHPASFLLALNKAKTTPQKAIMIGNSAKRDIRGAKLLGIKTVQITKILEASDEAIDDTTRADLITDSFIEIRKFIEKFNRK